MELRMKLEFASEMAQTSLKCKKKKKNGIKEKKSQWAYTLRSFRISGWAWARQAKLNLLNSAHLSEKLEI